MVIRRKIPLQKLRGNPVIQKIATVERSGSVKAKRVGKCTITGKFENGPVVKWHITVKRPAPRLNATMVSSCTNISASI